MNLALAPGVLAEFDSINDAAYRMCTLSRQVLNANGVNAETLRIRSQTLGKNQIELCWYWLARPSPQGSRASSHPRIG